MNKKIFCFFGPTCAGKTVLSKPLLNQNFGEIISHTTRAKRPGEKHGYDYYFVSQGEFSKIDMVEKSNANGSNYGIAKSEINNKMDKYDSLFIILDEIGIKFIKELYPDIAKTIYIYSSTDILHSRLLNRECSNEERQLRIKQLSEYKKNELRLFDLADYMIINNTTLQNSLELLQMIINKELSN